MMDTFSRNSYEQNHVPFDHHHDDDDHHHHHHDHDDDDHHQEESGWTTILEDFSNHYKATEGRDDHTVSSCSVRGGSPSLVSDAATGRDHRLLGGGGSPVGFPAKLKFRKVARTKEVVEDDSLEDTASSPINSPKVSQFEQIQTTPRKIDDYISSSFVMRNGDIHGDEERSMKMKSLRDNGLCVVPISMLANYNPPFH